MCFLAFAMFLFQNSDSLIFLLFIAIASPVNNVHCASLGGWAAVGCLIGLLRWCCCRFIGEAKRRETAALQLDVDGGREDAFGVVEQGATVHHVPQLAFHLAFECFAAVHAYGNRAVEVD